MAKRNAEGNAKQGRGPKYLKIEESFERAMKHALTKNDPPRKANKKRPATKK